MEFFAEVHGPLIEVQDLSDRLTISTLPAYCASIDTVLSAQSDSEGEIYCVWGQFKVSRQGLDHKSAHPRQAASANGVR